MRKAVLDPRRRLLDAGLRLFANRGYAGTSVHNIIDEAGVSKPSLYYYFGSKEGIFQALVDQAMEERLRLIREAADPAKETVDQLTDVIVAVTGFAHRQPDLLRLCFSIVFAAPEEFPSGRKKHPKMVESFLFLREIIQAGLSRGVLNAEFTADELTQAYFHLIQHSTVLALFESEMKRAKPPSCLPKRMEPRRIVELFLGGAASKKTLSLNGASLRRATRLTRTLLLAFGLGLSALGAQAQPTSSASTNEPPNATPPPPMTNAPPTLADVRPQPPAVRASHPELATVSPIDANANDPHALDLQTCFQLTAVRDDSLKISMQDINIARAQLSEAIAALWPTFTATNQQEFLHYRSSGNGGGITILGNSTIVGNRNYTSQSHVTMNYTIFNGGQNWNNVGANEANIAAKKQTLARDYQTIYQSVAQAFYDVLQFEGDLVIQHDLIDALQARVDDLTDRVKLGRSRPAELLQAQTDLANARVTTESQKGSLNAARETLAFYIGIPSSQFNLKETRKFPTAAQLESYIERCDARPDVLSQLDSLRQAERNLTAAEGQLLPTITAQGDFLASQDPASNQIDASMTLQASMPIFDGGLIISQIHQNKELVRQSALNVEQLKRTSDEDTRTAYVNFNSSAAQVVVLREAAIFAAQNLQAQVDDYVRGVVSNLDVLTALQDYQTARQQLHNANMQARLNLINLHVAAGIAATGPGANNQALPDSISTAK